MNYSLAFLTGLTTGGLTCLAVQGGLLAAVLANKNSPKERVLGIGAFLGAKLLAYTFLGLLLGLFGSVFQLTIGGRALLQIAIGGYLLVAAANLLELHPIFRYAVIQPPKFLMRKVRSSSKNEHLLAPILLGILTLFIPCATTQAMEVAAVGAGEPVSGALTMFFFILGTTPVFGGLALAAAKLGELWRAKFLRAAAYLLVLLGVLSLDGGLVLMNSPLTINSLKNEVIRVFTVDDGVNKVLAGNIVNGVQEVILNVTNDGYLPNTVSVKKGFPVQLRLNTNNTTSCTRAFVIPSLNIQKLLPRTGSEVVEFTPQKTGQIAFSCSMGMYGGVIFVN